MPARIAAWIANMAWQFQCFDSIRNCLKAFLIIFTGSITILTPLLAAEVPYLLFSPCTLEEDPDQEFPLFSSCLKANALLSVEQRSNIETEKQPPTSASANGSFAASITRFLVLDFAGHARVTKDRLEENIVDKDINSERTLLQIGNSAIHRHRLFAGISRPPIGLDLNIESQYLDFDEYKYFYSSPQKIFGYSYDNRKDIVWTIAGSAVNQSTLEPSERVARLSMRLSYDFAALEGSRVIGTFSTTELIQRVGGISLLNINGRGDRTSFEWLRTWSQYPYDPADFGQIFRVNWTGKSNDVVTTKIQYEDVSATHRQGLVIVSYEWSSVISTAITGGYHRNEIRELSISSERKSYWFGRFGLEATL